MTWCPRRIIPCPQVQFLRQAQGPSSGQAAVVHIQRREAGRFANGTLRIEYLCQID